jgi:PleD family two-component response regulator
MKDLAFALFVDGGSFMMEPLRPALHEMGISTWNCRTCKEFAALFDQTRPQLVFTDKDLSDGMWLRVAKLAMDADFPVSLFVVGDEPNTRLDDLVRECGGSGYLAPPFERVPFQAAVRAAVEEVYNRKCAAAETAA